MKKWVILLLTVFFCSAANAQTEFRIITLQHRFAQDILPVVQPSAGEDGSVSAIDNHLVVRATPERMSVIEQIVASLDVERRNLRITISHEAIEQGGRSSIGVAGRIKAGEARVGIDEHRLPGDVREGVVLEADSSEYEHHHRGSEYLTVLDGARAFIRVGQSVPFTSQWVTLARRYLHVQQTTEFRDITTGFAVRPRVAGDEIELEIAPGIARLNEAGFVDFEELSTVVRVRPGQWLDLGGTMQSRDEVSRLILSGREGSGREESKLMVRVDQGL